MVKAITRSPVFIEAPGLCIKCVSSSQKLLPVTDCYP